MIYLYAIIAPGHTYCGEGLGDQPLAYLSAHDLVAVHTEHPGPIDPAPANILRHEHVVECLMEHSPLLPTRFGTMFSDLAKLQDVLDLHHPRLRESLHHVRDCVELGLRVLWDPPAGGNGAPAPDESNPSTGREYMMRRLRQETERRSMEAEAQRISNDIHVILATHARDSVRRLLASPQLALSAAYLVQRKDLDPFTDELKQLRAAHPQLKMLLTGPWPPYNFAPTLPRPEVQHV